MTESKLSATDAPLRRRNLICMISAEGKTKRELAREEMQAVDKWRDAEARGHLSQFEPVLDVRAADEDEDDERN